jgi:hypothetical protein
MPTVRRNLMRKLTAGLYMSIDGVVDSLRCDRTMAARA